MLRLDKICASDVGRWETTIGVVSDGLKALLDSSCVPSPPPACGASDFDKTDVTDVGDGFSDGKM